MVPAPSSPPTLRSCPARSIFAFPASVTVPNSVQSVSSVSVTFDVMFVAANDGSATLAAIAAAEIIALHACFPMSVFLSDVALTGGLFKVLTKDIGLPKQSYAASFPMPFHAFVLPSFAIY